MPKLAAVSSPAGSCLSGSETLLLIRAAIHSAAGQRSPSHQVTKTRSKVQLAPTTALSASRDMLSHELTFVYAVSIPCAVLRRNTLANVNENEWSDAISAREDNSKLIPRQIDRLRAGVTMGLDRENSMSDLLRCRYVM